MLTLPRLYAIADVGTLQRRGLVLGDVVRGLVDGGVELLQLRHKDGSPQEVLRAAEVVTAAVGSANCLLVMNDRVDLMLLADWRAVHLGQGDLPPAAARTLAGEQGVIGVSTHTDKQVAEAEAGTSDYVAVGPVFSTSTKPDAEPVVGLDGVRRARALTCKPLVAIGGITRTNAAAVIEAGADSVAVISALYAGEGSIDAVARDFVRLLR